VNGERVDLKPAPDFAPEFFLTDYQDVSAFVGHLLKRGENALKVVSPTKLSEPLRLVGDFRVHLAEANTEHPESRACRRIEGALTLLPPADPDPFMLEADYPFFSGTVTYRAEFELDKPCTSLVLNLHDARDSVEVCVNGKSAGKRLWQPYTFDIASLTQPGVNKLTIEVRNNMANLILGNPRPLGLREMPSLAGLNS
jgi:hypothetical protein